MRVAALYDIHGNLPALEAVLDEVRQAGVDHVVVGGDVVPGPMVRETLTRLLDLDLPVQLILGNCEVAVLDLLAGRDPGPLPEPVLEAFRWTTEQLPEYEPVFASWPKTLRLDIPGLGEVLFCHGTPRHENEIFTCLTAEDRLLPVFAGLNVPLVVCGHTHMQFDRKVGETRVVNAGSVGMPFGEPGAWWLLLGPDVELRRTLYDLTQAAQSFRETSYPLAADFAQETLQPRSESEMLALGARAELRYGPEPTGASG
jgi:putative phosphoesterase